jgi:coenzyme F420 hydrogenase subunit beta
MSNPPAAPKPNPTPAPTPSARPAPAPGTAAKPAAPPTPAPAPLKSSVEGEGWKPLPKKLKIFGNLVSEVVNKGICMYCGACIASCPIDILFHSDKEEPIMRGTCAACQVCYYSCPRIELPLSEIEQRIFGRPRTPDEAILGIHIGMYSARAKDPAIIAKAQDGGATTAFLLYALDQKLIDYALVSGFSAYDPWRPEPQAARNREELLNSAGSRYTPGGQVGGLAEVAIPNRSGINNLEDRIAVVALPCELQGMWRMNTHWIATPKLAKNLVFTIGLYCSKVFDYGKMMVDYVEGKRGIDLKTVTKVNVKKNRLLVYVGDKLALDEPVEVIHGIAREECNVCIDYSAELADLAIGAIGSAQGWSTVITRTPRAEEILKGAQDAGYVEVKNLDPMGKGIKLLERLCVKKRQRDPSHYMRHETAFPKPEPILIPLQVPAK